MSEDLARRLENSMRTSFIDHSYQSEQALRPQLLWNDYSQGKKVLSSLAEEFSHCKAFFISVAFITEGGLTPLLQVLKELEDKGVPGQILTTDYLSFTEPNALTRLHQFSNIELRMYETRGHEGFHTKGYIFVGEDDTLRIITGSSNLTGAALTVNKEWNTKVVSCTDGEYGQHVLGEFRSLWEDKRTKSFEEFIYSYEQAYEIEKAQKLMVKEQKHPDLLAYKLRPNAMQTHFAANLSHLLQLGESRALLISATGTGKTYASAFALRELHQGRILFLVHREQIARQAMNSYRRVFGEKISMGILSGKTKSMHTDIVFSTMQTMAKDYIRQKFANDAFDIIVIDEVHRAGSKSYQSIMDHFRPRLYLGMSASPERTDDFDIYKLFHHNIAHEIRLREALEEDLLCPFHYFGITDFEVNGEARDLRDFNDLEVFEKARYIKNKLDFYGYSGERVKGLMFLSTICEAERLQKAFTSLGLRTCVLSGEDDQSTREEAIDRLTSNTREDILDYVLSVDILNEGVDIPEVNQIVLLRPTQSPIIFVQQLGRGLRKFAGKDYLVIVDFIANHQNNYMIPMALFGDRSYNKDNLRRVVQEGTRIIPGCSSISFDEISREAIYRSIDVANFSDSRIVKNAYKNLKCKLGRIPKLMDFEEYASIDPLRIFENKSFGSYYGLVAKMEANQPEFSQAERKMLAFLSQKFASGKRLHELFILRALLDEKQDVFELLRQELSLRGLEHHDLVIENVRLVLNGTFFRENATGFVEGDRFSEHFCEALTNPAFRTHIEELVDFGLYRHEKDYRKYYSSTAFNLYQKYTYDEILRLLNWKRDEVKLNIGGYKYDEYTKTYPVFINYHKEDHINETIKYEDRFLSPSRLIALSKSNRTLLSKDVETALQAKERGVRMELFVRKNKDDKTSKEFYYLGRMQAQGGVEVTMQNTTSKAVEIDYVLEVAVREELFDYLTS